jgi:hypothetical protein
VARPQNSSGSPKPEQPAPLLKIPPDLKPTLEGFSGIPQETCLLFQWLRRSDGVEFTGLIQQGSSKLQRALPLHSAGLPASDRVRRSSHTIMSLEQNLHLGVPAQRWDKARRHFAPYTLLWDTLWGRELRTSCFDRTPFLDFVWRTFFSKTLYAAR